MTLSFEEVNILGNIINDTWGNSSTGEEEWEVGIKNPSTVVTKSSLQDDVLSVMSLSIINLGSYHEQHKQIDSIEKELNTYIKKYINNIKKEFKKKENAGRALTCKQVKDSEDTNVEIINPYASTRAAYVRRTVNFEIK